MNFRHLLAAGVIAAGFTALPAAAQHAGDAFIAAFDSNGDGSLTRAEYDAARAARFKATDADGDGAFSEEEYVAEFTARFEQQLAKSDRSAEKKAEERQRQIRQTHVRFGVLDTNKDSRIGRDEYDRVAERSFAEQDADKNGIVAANDVAATTAKRTAARAE
ncbi:hypothetical protein ACMGDH_14260 [Sphingomonas sp. DT-207]|uniref:hypothetical protein n=1 Tax=Sphingomonas sp. DT-207 TaxID=3396167 RepID=UPI003F1C124B